MKVQTLESYETKPDVTFYYLIARWTRDQKFGGSILSAKRAVYLEVNRAFELHGTPFTVYSAR